MTDTVAIDMFIVATATFRILYTASWTASMTEVVAAYQAMRGVSFVVAATLAEIGDLRRFANPRQLMAFLGFGAVGAFHWG